MKFLEMVDSVRTYGISNRPDKVLDFFRLVEKNQVFILQYEEIPWDRREVPKEFNGADFDLPFDVISVEYPDRSLTVPREGEPQVYLECIMIDDSGKMPGYYLYGFMPGNTGRCLYMDSSEDIQNYSPTTNLCKQFTERINTQKAGREIVKEKIKIKTKDGNKFHKINQVIRISSSKKYFTDYGRETGRTIDFSHRFFRRGHWRKLENNKIGKNRSGDYVMAGKTWVLESVVGDENLPLIKKTRVVESDNGPK